MKFKLHCFSFFFTLVCGCTSFKPSVVFYLFLFLRYYSSLSLFPFHPSRSHSRRSHSISLLILTLNISAKSTSVDCKTGKNSSDRHDLQGNYRETSQRKWETHMYERWVQCELFYSLGHLQAEVYLAPCRSVDLAPCKMSISAQVRVTFSEKRWTCSESPRNRAIHSQFNFNSGFGESDFTTLNTILHKKCHRCTCSPDHIENEGSVAFRYPRHYVSLHSPLGSSYNERCYSSLEFLGAATGYYSVPMVKYGEITSRESQIPCRSQYLTKPTSKFS